MTRWSADELIQASIDAKKARDEEPSWGRFIAVFVVCCVLALGVYVIAVLAGAPVAR